jgi:hypothetical protein
MRGIASVLVVLSLSSCTNKTIPLSPENRGAAFFAATAEKLGALVVADLKATKETWYKAYLQETGAKDDAELGRKIAGDLQRECARAFALTEPQEAALKAGRFADAENREKIKKAAEKFGPDRPVPDAYRIALAKVDSGDWGKGVELEFVARLLQYQPAKR